MDNIITTIAIAIFASTGFWTFVQTIYQNRSNSKKAERDLWKFVALDRIIDEGNRLIEKGKVSPIEYEDYEKGCKAYFKLHGNGVGKAKYEEFKSKVSIE